MILEEPKRSKAILALSFVARLLVVLIILYRKIAPARIRASCRFLPTCSEFSIQAISRWGFWLGLQLIVRRLALCKPPFGGILEAPVTREGYTSFLNLPKYCRYRGRNTLTF